MRALANLVLGCFCLCASSLALSPQEIVKRADAVRGPDGAFSFKVRVKDFQGSSLVRENIYKVFSKNMKLTLVETIFPERLTGRKLLMAGGMWLYLPSLRRATRVSDQQRLTGEVANGDIARTNYHRDYKATLAGTSKIGSDSYYELALTAKDSSLAYRKIHLWVNTKTFAPLKADFYALSGKLLKTGEYSELETVLGKSRLTKLVIKDAVQPSKQSHLKYSDYRREKLDDSFFNKESLSD